VVQHPFHSAEEMRQISNLAHVLEGAVLGIAAAIAFLQARSPAPSGSRRYAWQALIATAGLVLLGYLLVPYHGVSLAREQWEYVWTDPQQRQHLAMALLLMVGGGCELLTATGVVTQRAWRFGWPLGLVGIGALFVIHQQHGTTDAVARAEMIHRVLGATLVITGLLAAAAARSSPSRPTWARLWPLTLLVVALLLVIYREPEGAHEHGSAVRRSSALGARL
jgi:hypothetical protein